MTVALQGGKSEAQPVEEEQNPQDFRIEDKSSFLGMDKGFSL